MKIFILGGGLSGLSLCWHLSKNKNIEIKLLESSNRMGGWLHSKRIEGFLFETGARSISPKPHQIPIIASLIKDLDLEKDLMYIGKKSEVNQNKHLLLNGKVTQIPSDISALFHPATRHIPQALLKDLFLPKLKGQDDESVASFFTRRFHPSIADQIMSSFIHGIYGGDVEKWSLRCQFPQMWDLEQRYRSILLGFLLSKQKFQPQSELEKILFQNTFFSFRNGISELTEALESQLSRLDNVELIKETPCESLTFDDPFKIKTKERDYKADYVISTLPAHQLAHIIPKLLKSISQIPFQTLIPVNFAWKKKLNIPIKPTIGFLIPYKEKCLATGVILDSVIFPERQPKDSTVITIMLNGQKCFETFGSLNQEHLESCALEILKDTLNIKEAPDIVQSSINHSCMPQYHVGHLQLVQELEKQLLNESKGRFYIMGANFKGIGIPDCITQTYHFSNQFLDKIK